MIEEKQKKMKLPFSKDGLVTAFVFDAHCILIAVNFRFPPCLAILFLRNFMFHSFAWCLEGHQSDETGGENGSDKQKSGPTISN